MSTPRVLCVGLQPEPLAAYLGALGILRMLNSSGHTVRGAFSPEGFFLEGIAREALLDFVLTRWKPSIVLSPWNNASGFYAAPKPKKGEKRARSDDETDAKNAKGKKIREALNRVVDCDDSRFDVLSRAIASIRSRVTARNAPNDADKARFIAQLRAWLPDDALQWVDAAAVISNDKSTMMPLLGSGANEGPLDHAGRYVLSVVEMLLSNEQQTSRRLLESALFGTTATGLSKQSVGQASPGSAGGFNTGPGFETKDMPNNPWAFVFFIEGSMTWVSGLASKQVGEASGYTFAVSPFTVRHVAAGYASAGRAEDDSRKVRAEIWAPIWTRSATIAEITRFIAEGRVDVQSRQGQARRATDSLDFAEAVGSLGTGRGVQSFIRYTIVKRRGDNYLATPVGRLSVIHRTEIDLLRQLDAQLGTLDSFLGKFKGDGPPAHLVSLRRSVSDAHFDVATRGGPDAMRRIVRALGALERVLSKRDTARPPKLSRPLGGLGGNWVAACGDSAEVRLAASLASLRATGGAGPLRANVAAIDPKKESEYAKGGNQQAWFGANLTTRLAHVLKRRLLDAENTDAHDTRNPTWGTRPVSLSDIGGFFEPGAVDEQALEDLLFGFTWVNHSDADGTSENARPHAMPPPREYALLKLLFLPNGLTLHEGRPPIRLRPPAALVPLLISGRVDDAIAVARSQLRARGLRPRRLDRLGRIDAAFGGRLAASLLFPMFQTRSLVEDALLSDPSEENHDAQ
ncbi:MAG: type I-U CRISPR-associated protein Csx17 [Archangium gephyra]|uniref:Type I-U CRISPR-associated protein Csx17 n=1 Tax=Archangium gephyra TaxID=48 RepID=A0A2W5SZP0_9BACT|nr:MAG: type I-U CRISPR-associated protein Csx17 [Archangium gephyra]